MEAPRKALSHHLSVAATNTKQGSWGNHSTYKHTFINWLGWINWKPMQTLHRASRRRWVMGLTQQRQMVSNARNKVVSRESRQFWKGLKSSQQRMKLRVTKYLEPCERRFANQKKLKLLRSVHSWFSTALDYNTYCLVEMTLMFEGEVTKHNEKWVLRLQVQMKAFVLGRMYPVWITGFIPTCVHDGVW